MSRKCDITGQSAVVGHKVSHSNRKTKIRNEVHLVSQKFWNPETKKWMKFDRVSVRTIRTIGRKGLLHVLKKARQRVGKKANKG